MKMADHDLTLDENHGICVTLEKMCKARQLEEKKIHEAITKGHKHTSSSTPTFFLLMVCLAEPMCAFLGEIKTSLPPMPCLRGHEELLGKCKNCGVSQSRFSPYNRDKSWVETTFNPFFLGNKTLLMQAETLRSGKQ